MEKPCESIFSSGDELRFLFLSVKLSKNISEEIQWMNSSNHVCANYGQRSIVAHQALSSGPSELKEIP